MKGYLVLSITVYTILGFGFSLGIINEFVLTIKQNYLAFLNAVGISCLVVSWLIYRDKIKTLQAKNDLMLTDWIEKSIKKEDG